mgnify:CR=1 FL=1
MSTVPPDPGQISPISPSSVLTMFRNWMRTIVEMNVRAPDERNEFREPPVWLRGTLLASFAGYLYALTKLAAYDVPAVTALTVVYGLTMLVPPVPSPLGMIRTPRVAFLVTLMLLWSPIDTLIAIAFGTLLAVLAFRLYEPWRALVNTVWWAYPAALASAVGHVILRAIPGRLAGLTVASLVILIVYLLANFALLALYRRLRHREPFFSYWWSCLTENPLSQVLAAPVPILLGTIAFGVGRGPWMVLLLTSLSAVTMPAVRAQLAVFLASQRTVQDIVRALMIALERSVPDAHAHAQRVSVLVEEVGRRMRVPAATLEQWRTAALLHDIGLIDAGSRTASPMSHAIAGARILASYPDTMVADMVREHHTPWSAVTPRLRGTAALGARVLAAVECYDELRYGTPVNPGKVTHAATAAALRPLIGSQLDPRVTPVLLETAEWFEPKAAS